MEEHPTVGPGGGWSGASPGHPLPGTLNDLPYVLVPPVTYMVLLEIASSSYSLTELVSTIVCRPRNCGVIPIGCLRLFYDVHCVSPPARLHVQFDYVECRVWNHCECISCDVNEVELSFHVP